jgi:hypothetical protein
MNHVKNILPAVAVFIMTTLSALHGQPSQTPGTWKNVSDPVMVMSGSWVNGPIAVLVDRVRQSDIYVNVDWDGTWKSTDYGFTWKKVSTGQGGSVQNGGCAVYAAIDMNPKRDLATSPTIYLALFQAGGIWKSTNGGVDWVNTWNNNIFLEDGVTNISTDVGSDMSGVMITDSTGPNHLLAYLHGYWGTGGNNGVFESTDGGGKWVVHKSQTFNFTAHADVLFPIDSATWCVAHGYPGDVYRTTNSGASWSIVENGNFFGRIYCQVGSTFYAAGSPSTGVFKSSNKGATWTHLSAPGFTGQITATANYIYSLSGQDGAVPELYRAPVGNDASWTKVSVDMTGMQCGHPGVATTFDGTHSIIISGQRNSGVWRYVEPAVGTEVDNQKALTSNNQSSPKVIWQNGRFLVDALAGIPWNLEIFSLDGRSLVKHSSIGPSSVSFDNHASTNSFVIAKYQSSGKEMVSKVFIR